MVEATVSVPIFVVNVALSVSLATAVVIVGVPIFSVLMKVVKVELSVATTIVVVP